MKGLLCIPLIVLLAVPYILSQDPPDSSVTSSSTEESVESSTDVTEEEGEDEDELQSNDPNTIAFYLYPNAENDSYFEEIRIGDADSLGSYSPSKTPIILIHGFVNNYTCKFSQRVKDALLEAGMADKHNIILVDWGPLSTPKNSTNLGSKPLNDLARNPFYQKAVNNVPKVGRRVAEFLDFLVIENQLESPSDVYLIGFSLGSHVAGCAGYEVKQRTSTLIGRITGLDPAGPGYQSQTNLALRLDPSDGESVEIIHTNSGQSGYEGNCGTSDFYPNGGGPNQNDCIGGSNGVEQISGNVAGICAHNRAWVYYIKALQTEVYACKCYATPDYWCRLRCPSKVLFGYWTPPSTKGTYYVDIYAKEYVDNFPLSRVLTHSYFQGWFSINF